MTLDPVLFAPTHVQVHIAAASLAVLIGPLAIFRRRRDRLHRAAGYAWVAAMTVTAVSSFWITSFGVIGPFSPIHVLSVFVLWSLGQGIAAVRRGDIAAHRGAMEGLYWRALLLAGALTFLPGRALNRAVFGEAEMLGYLVAGMGTALIFLGPVLRRRARTRSARPA